MKKWCLLILFFISATRVGVLAGTDFLTQIKNCYCSADWVCKDFADMSLPEFLSSWQHLSELISDERKRWFYAYDTPAAYQRRLKDYYSNFERYDRESLDTEWLRECEQYHTFLTTHYLDTRRGVIVQKIQKKRKKPIHLKKHYLQLQDLLVQMVPEAHFSFYRFFFEQLTNVMLKKLNYVYFEEEMSLEHIMELLKHKQLMTQIYRTCLHKTKQASATYAHKMAYHYDRIESVLDMVVSELLKRIGFE
ncbi:TPA: hypothetical protein DIC20_04095 [Candidatus Dependentiae bacterium]|nr:hypothetical protein [Candidatus Dependentiae bacterium]HCU00857.1 hypothetical protein [Candidatus Dependentiae bacterium]